MELPSPTSAPAPPRPPVPPRPVAAEGQPSLLARGASVERGSDPSAPSGPRDLVDISDLGRAALAGERSADGDALTEQEREVVRELQARDREVRAHEQAHKAAAGDLAAGGPTYQYERGPDGNDYAVGGEVQIALREGDTPEETARIAQRARRAALAPAEPSAQDRRVAAEAAQMEARARSEAQERAAAERRGEDPEAARAAGAYRATSAAPIQIPNLLGELFG